jgi:hypothetical protein
VRFAQQTQSDAAYHLLHAPLFTKHKQPLGTAGKNGQWDGSFMAPDAAAVIQFLNANKRGQLSPADIIAW